jgi:hypothetical protein
MLRIIKHRLLWLLEIWKIDDKQKNAVSNRQINEHKKEVR